MNSITKICIIEGCGTKKHSKDYCGNHLYRIKNYGSPHITKATRHGVPKRFFDEAMKLETDDCIIWKYSKSYGYGDFRYKGKRYLVTKLSLEIHTGKAPEGKPYALHKPVVCHNRACFNYRHLYWGDKRDNAMDKVLDDTHNRGERAPTSKLTELQVLQIRKGPRKYAEIANDYGIRPNSISRIKTGKRWAWL